MPETPEGGMSDENPTEDAWASIVANFGERAQLSEEELTPEPATESEPREFYVPFESDEHYVPPEAPLVGLADGPRGAAWIGLIGAPALFLIALITGISIPHWLALFAVVAFVASIVYLFATMRHHDDDPWDDGARV